MLNTWLQNLVALGGQFNTGLLHAKRNFHDICPDDTSREYLALCLDWVFAKHAADALCHEIKQMLEDQNHPEYSTNVPLAAGNTFAHLHAILEQPNFT